MSRKFKVLGLYQDIKGCSSDLHPACGIAIVPYDLVVVYKEEVIVDGCLKYASFV